MAHDGNVTVVVVVVVVVNGFRLRLPRSFAGAPAHARDFLAFYFGIAVSYDFRAFFSGIAFSALWSRALAGDFLTICHETRSCVATHRDVLERRVPDTEAPRSRAHAYDSRSLLSIGISLPFVAPLQPFVAPSLPFVA
eukprot:437998-Pyramimonas_sp.AAC.1